MNVIKEDLNTEDRIYHPYHSNSELLLCTVYEQLNKSPPIIKQK
jgi:hypothetical protein